MTLPTTPTPLILPAIRGKLGDWAFYTSIVSLGEIAARVRLAEEIHTSKKLNELIQRQVTDRSALIRDYLLSQKQRFFNSLVIAVYGGAPQWYELSVSSDPARGLGELPESIDGMHGVLVLSGTEHLFALDGQHRLVGIKEAVKQNPELATDEVGVVFVAHDTTDAGMLRTRRLFTTLNRYAKPVSFFEKIAMDEDDLVAIVTRRMVDEYALFTDAISQSKGKQILVTDRQNVTTLPALYDVLDLYLKTGTSARWEADKRFRPPDNSIDGAYVRARELFDALCGKIEPFREIQDGTPAREVVPRYRDRRTGGHLALRPIGLQLIVTVVRDFMNIGLNVVEAVGRISHVPMALAVPPWVGLLWDPTNQRMNYRAENQRIARWVLYYGSGGDLDRLGGGSSFDRARRELTGVLFPDNPSVEMVDLQRYTPAPLNQ